MIDSIFDSIFDVFGKFRREAAIDYFDLCHNCDTNTLVTDGGSLVTVMKVHGLQAIDGENEWREAALAIENALKMLFNREGVTFQWVFEKNDHKTLQSLIDATAPNYKAMRDLDLDIKDIMMENIAVNREFVCYESSYIAIWSDLRLIDSQLAKNRIRENSEHALNLDLLLKECPNIFGVISELMVKHSALVEEFLFAMRRGRLDLKELSAHEACNAIKLQYHEGTNRDWSPMLIGDRRHLRTITDGEPNADGSELFWVPIKKQVANKPIEYTKPGVVKIGENYSKTGVVEVFPETLKPFRTLIEKIDKNIPFRLSFKLRSGKGKLWALRQTIFAFTQFAHADNSRVVAEMQKLEANKESVPSIRLSMSFSTTSLQVDKLEYYYSRIEQAIQGWGSSYVTEDKIDEHAAFCSTVVGASANSSLPETYAPVDDVVKLLPFDRTSSVWDHGFTLFRTLQGKMFPWAAINTLTRPAIELYIARSRQGKSVLSNSILMGLVLGGGNVELPYSCTIDVGPSSVGVHQFIKDRLPEHNRHLVETYVMEFDNGDYINPCQKYPCVDSLFPFQREFLHGFLMLLCQNSKGESHVDMEGYLDALISEVYAHKAEESPTEYVAGLEKGVDEWIKNTQFELNPDTNWREIELALGEADEWDLAGRCAVYSSPVLSEFRDVSRQSRSLERTYGDEMDGPGAEFRKRVEEASKKYPVFCKHSTKSFAESRLRTIDLQNVLTKDENIGPRQNGLMFNFALYVGSGDFMISKNCLYQIENRFKPHYEKLIARIRALPARLFVDEFHNCGGLRQTVANVEKYFREGGKWGINSALSSQSFVDMTDTMIGQATSYFFLGGVSREVAQKMKEKFSLSESDVKALTDGTVHGPKRDGSCLLYVYKTQDGQFSQTLKFAAGKKLLWVNSTHPEDLTLKEIVTKELGTNDCTTALAEYFPSGTSVDEVERIKASGESTGDILEMIKDRVVESFRLKNQAA
ncbi:hypothetical protein [Shewanella colwelliana]|uniref:hypothetical protein n=1 Tax=Shewanella colwelliana TaxID=23 RepID=UPI0022AFC2EC|nr:hypothetical protein [Shewanella colwelliana]MCZ4337770.1 hypothetical protein [Shewanella colwelliana]